MESRSGTAARPLQGRTAVVAGADGALAAAIARRLLADGAGLLVAAPDEETALSLEAELTAEGGPVYAVAADPGRARDADALFGEALRVFGGVDVAVAVAATPEPPGGGPFDLDDAGFERALLTAMRPAFAIAQRAARLMTARGRGGSVVLVEARSAGGRASGSDVAGGTAGPSVVVAEGTHGAPARVAAGALDAFAREMAAAGGAHGVRVNHVRAESGGQAASAPGTAATAADVAAAVAFLASPRASYVSGAILPVGGAGLPVGGAGRHDGGGRRTPSKLPTAHGAPQAVLVADGARGAGLACCRAFLAAGAGVVFCGTSGERVEAAASALEGLGGGPVAGYVCDVTDAAAVGQVVSESLRLFGRLDVCVAVAGTGASGPFDHVPSAPLEPQLTVDLLGVQNVLVAAGSVMREQGAGSIVTLGPVNGVRADTEGVTYCASAAALHQLTRSVARELAPHGVRANCVAPGWVDVGTDEGVPEDAEDVRATCAVIPLGRRARPEELAAVVTFLAGDEAAAISGAVVAADGGLTAR